MWSNQAGLDAAQRQLDQWESSLAARAAKTSELSQQLAGLTATAHSEDGSVEATVEASGVLLGLRLDDQIRAQAASRTAEQILATIRAAHETAVRQASAITVEALGEDDPAGRAIVDAHEKRLRRDGLDA
ncbi:MAG TPA: YbaB/EbfC family nucleoid-associated protein [Jiangellales bacterium]|nr:YbaB/EbfC family nucleoid-associated protein [Jiangellales bacterium]